MKEYHSIPGATAKGTPQGHPCLAFRKYDGSNLRFEWQAKKGWHLFGTRHRLFDRTDPEFGDAIDVFLARYADGVEEAIRRHKELRGAKEVVCFCEYFGPYSFGGQHDPKHPAVILGGCKGENSPKGLVMFDVNVHKKGLLPPTTFLHVFENLPIAEVVYAGNMNQEFVEDVRAGKYPVVEGVVCKGVIGKAPHGIWMAKVKTRAYLEELKRRFAADWEKYAE